MESGSPIDAFPLPTPAPSVQQVAERTALHYQGMQYPLEVLNSDLLDRTMSGQATVKGLNARMRQVLGNRTKGSRQQIAKLGGAMVDALQVRTAESAATASTLPPAALAAVKPVAPGPSGGQIVYWCVTLQAQGNTQVINLPAGQQPPPPWIVVGGPYLDLASATNACAAFQAQQSAQGGNLVIGGNVTTNGGNGTVTLTNGNLTTTSVTTTNGPVLTYWCMNPATFGGQAIATTTTGLPPPPPAQVLSGPYLTLAAATDACGATTTVTNGNGTDTTTITCPPPPGVQYWCVGPPPQGEPQQPLAVPDTVTQADIVAMGWVVNGGPWPDPITAANNCPLTLVQCETCPVCPTCPICPECPPPPPPPLLWWCLQPSAQSQSSGVQPAPFVTQLTSLITVEQLRNNGYSAWDGPHDSQADAENSPLCNQTVIEVGGWGATDAPGLPNWCDVNAYKDVEAAAKGIKDWMQSWLPAPLWQAFTVPDFDPSRIGDAIARKIGGEAGQAVALGVEVLLDMVNVCFAGAFASADCNVPAAAGASMLGKLLGVLNQYTGGALRDLQTQVEYTKHYFCPVQIPGVGESHRAYLANLIDVPQWHSWVSANNQCPEPASKVMASMRTRPGTHDIVQLRWRQVITTDDDYRKRMRGEGVVNAEERDLLEAAMRPWPTVPAVIEAWARGMWDDPALQVYGYQSNFPLGFPQQVQDLVRGTGASPESGSIAWNNHWRVPTPSEVLVMMDRTLVDQQGNFLPVTQEQYLHVCEVHGLTPYWAARVQAMHARLLSVGEIHEAFNWFTLGGPEARQLLREHGYSTGNATRLVVSWGITRIRFWSGNEYGRAYINGSLSRPQLLAILTGQGGTVEDALALILRLDEIVAINAREACIRGVRRQMLRGLIDQQTAGAELLQLGVDPITALQLSSGMACTLKAQGKLLPAARICKFAAEGIMTYGQMSTALTNLGYQPADVARMVKECQLNQQAKAAAAAAKAKAAQAKALASQQKAAQKAAQQSAKAKAAQQKADEKAALKTLALSQAVMELTGATIDQAQSAVAVLQAQVMGALGMDLATATALIASVVATAKKENRQDWQAMVHEAIGSMS